MDPPIYTAKASLMYNGEVKNSFEIKKVPFLALRTKGGEFEVFKSNKHTGMILEFESLMNWILKNAGHASTFAQCPFIK